MVHLTNNITSQTYKLKQLFETETPRVTLFLGSLSSLRRAQEKKIEKIRQKN